MNAIDTNVFTYAFDATEPAKQALARALFQEAFASAGVTRLYSEDMQHGADYDGVKIVNPFV